MPKICRRLGGWTIGRRSLICYGKNSDASWEMTRVQRTVLQTRAPVLPQIHNSRHPSPAPRWILGWILGGSTATHSSTGVRWMYRAPTSTVRCMDDWLPISHLLREKCSKVRFSRGTDISRSWEMSMSAHEFDGLSYEHGRPSFPNPQFSSPSPALQPKSTTINGATADVSGAHPRCLVQ